MNFKNIPLPINDAEDRAARILSCSRGSRCNLRILIVAAHPDDETLGACAAMSRAAESTVLFLTDGAPQNPRFRSAGDRISREEYAAIRRKEAMTALALMGILRKRIMFLNGTDQETIHQLPMLLGKTAEILRTVRPDAVITHSYEGGHPDHDVAALIVAAAMGNFSSSGSTPPAVFEMTSYHAAEGKCVTNKFLAPQRGCISTQEYEIWLSPEERARKEQMLGCYRSQKSIISAFQVEPERLRAVPQYDFRRSPHPGKLWYECLSWPMTGRVWRSQAKKALLQREMKQCA